MADISSQFEESATSPGLALWQVTNTWQREMRRTLKPLGLTHVQFVVLASTAWLSGDEPVRQADIAAHARLDVMMTSQVVRALVEKKLLLTAPAKDRRAYALSVSEAGLTLIRRAIPLVEAADAAFFGRQGAVLAATLGALPGMAP